MAFGIVHGLNVRPIKALFPQNCFATNSRMSSTTTPEAVRKIPLMSAPEESGGDVSRHTNCAGRIRRWHPSMHGVPPVHKQSTSSSSVTIGNRSCVQAMAGSPSPLFRLSALALFQFSISVY
ncbi:hypothetical protein Bbelb_109750 [Branchiostoma belcheri]|nr:hypothetical protein Bbelb_109750 [Branchiostoma belcheri]